MTADHDPLFAFILDHHGSRPWGHVLDAGTGEHSLRWVAALPALRWTAVTGREQVAQKLRGQYAQQPGRENQVLVGDWADPSFLAGQVFDVILADYLLGVALEEFSPYFQDRLFARLHRHAAPAGAIYVVGLAPYPHRTDSPWGRLILDIARLRDAVTLLAGHRPFREFPRDWAERRLAEAGFVVEAARSFTITYGMRFIHGQMDTCRNNIALIEDKRLAGELRRKCEELLARAAALADGDRRFGENYVLCARRGG